MSSQNSQSGTFADLPDLIDGLVTRFRYELMDQSIDSLDNMGFDEKFVQACLLVATQVNERIVDRRVKLKTSLKDALLYSSPRKMIFKGSPLKPQKLCDETTMEVRKKLVLDKAKPPSPGVVIPETEETESAKAPKAKKKARFAPGNTSTQECPRTDPMDVFESQLPETMAMY